MEMNIDAIKFSGECIVLRFANPVDTIKAVGELFDYYGSDINGDHIEVTPTTIKIKGTENSFNILQLLENITGDAWLVKKDYTKCL